MKLLALSAVLLAAPASAGAPTEVVYDAAVGANKGLRSASVGLAQRHAVLWRNRVLLGYGARFSLLTGDLELTGRGGDSDETLSVEGAKVLALNAVFHAALKVAEPFELGFNIDVAGIGGGSSENATYRSSPGAAPVRVGAEPARGNLLLIGPRDKGTLNSEWYAAWRLTPSFTVRAGWSHFLAGYRTDRELGGRREFKRFSDLGFVAVRWTP